MAQLQPCPSHRHAQAASAAEAGPARFGQRAFKLLLTLALLLTLTFLLTPALPLHAQGCTQCLDSTRATPPQVQSAFRHAIFLLGGAGAALFLTGTLLLRSKR